MHKPRSQTAFFYVLNVSQNTVRYNSQYFTKLLRGVYDFNKGL